MKSNTITIYQVQHLTQEQINFVDEVYELCEKHYSHGGDTVIECMTPQEVLSQFKDLEAVRAYCGLILEQAANARWGEDTDPQLIALQEFDKNWQRHCVVCEKPFTPHHGEYSRCPDCLNQQTTAGEIATGTQ